jgi:hypothetical protein
MRANYCRYQLEARSLGKSFGGDLAWNGKTLRTSVFIRKLATPKLYEFEDDWFTVLEKVQATTSHIADDVDVREVYGIARLERRGGVTAHARNMDVARCGAIERGKPLEERS